MINYYKNANIIDIDDKLNNINNYLSSLNIDDNIKLKSMYSYELCNILFDYLKNININLHIIPFVDNKYFDDCNINNIEYIIPDKTIFKYINTKNILYGDFKQKYLGNSIVFSNIILSSHTTCFSPSIMIHELMHTQLLSTNSLTNYLNYEVLSIFFEKTILDEIDYSKILLKKEYLLKIKVLCNAINSYNDYDDNKKMYLSMIIESILKSELLFNIYINANYNERKYILHDIQNVLDDKITLEKFLDIYGIIKDNYKQLSLIKNNLNYIGIKK